MANDQATRGFRTFTAIWLGQIVSLLGSTMTSFALGIWVLKKTSSVTQFALVVVIAGLPGCAHRAARRSARRPLEPPLRAARCRSGRCLGDPLDRAAPAGRGARGLAHLHHGSHQRDARHLPMACLRRLDHTPDPERALCPGQRNGPVRPRRLHHRGPGSGWRPMVLRRPLGHHLHRLRHLPLRLYRPAHRPHPATGNHRRGSRPAKARSGRRRPMAGLTSRNGPG